MKTRRGFLIGFLAAAIAALGPAQAAETGVAAQILEADRARLDAMLMADVGALEKALTNECLYVHSYGVTQTKEEFVTAFRKRSLVYQKLAYVGEPVVRVLGRDVAVITGRMALEVVNAEGRTLTPELLLTAVYVREDGTWKLASYQSTPAAKP